MNRHAWFVLLLVPVLAGCPTDTEPGSGGDNPLVSMIQDNCGPYCLKYQECNKAVFDLKWGTLAACEQACDPVMVAAACNTKCDTDHASDATRHEKCVDSCDAQISVAGCQVMCEGISDTSAHAQCDAGCVRQFSQGCADVREGINKCYLELECERVILHKDFGGSASDLGECTNDDGVSSSC